MQCTILLLLNLNICRHPLSLSHVIPTVDVSEKEKLMIDEKKKKPFRFSSSDDIVLLREVIANNPYSASESKKKWEEIANATQLHGLSGRRCRERTSRLLSFYKKEDACKLQREPLSPENLHEGDKTNKHVIISEKKYESLNFVKFPFRKLGKGDPLYFNGNIVNPNNFQLDLKKRFSEKNINKGKTGKNLEEVK